jgi:ABC-2 type transport system ATP-binding protein
MAAIVAEGLVKRFGPHTAVDGVSFEIGRGEIVGFLGPNGAGKSTTMKMLTGYLAPDGGQAAVAGYNSLTHPKQVRSRLGYLPENAPLYPDMHVRDYLDFVADVRGLAKAERAAAIQRVSSRCGLDRYLSRPCGTLSKGYRQRVGLAQALLHEPEILILDEPTTGLDPNQIVEIRNLILELGREKTILLSTHILSEVHSTCSRVLIVHEGQLVADGSTGSIAARQQGGSLVHVTYVAAKVRLGRQALMEVIEALPAVHRVEAREALGDNELSFAVYAGSDPRQALFQIAVDQGLVLVDMHSDVTSLEEVFRRLTTSQTG